MECLAGDDIELGATCWELDELAIIFEGLGYGYLGKISEIADQYFDDWDYIVFGEAIFLHLKQQNLRNDRVNDASWQLFPAKFLSQLLNDCILVVAEYLRLLQNENDVL